jgi:hypothetical protein
MFFIGDNYSQAKNARVYLFSEEHSFIASVIGRLLYCACNLKVHSEICYPFQWRTVHLVAVFGFCLKKLDSWNGQAAMVFEGSMTEFRAVSGANLRACCKFQPAAIR